MRAIKAFIPAVLNILFPAFCVGCDSEGRWICTDCLLKTNALDHSFCPKCTIPTKDGVPCKMCDGESFVDRLVVCVRFEEGTFREAIHCFKYDGTRDIGGILAKVMTEKLRTTQIPIDNLMVVAVPLHKKRLSKRGFNQSEILAKHITRAFFTTTTRGLVRIKETTPQADLRKEDRLKNLRGAFVWKGTPPTGKKILLVDDVSTTGATLQECARVLKKAGASEVIAVVLAHR